ncbi:hypothetical protein NRA25_18595, partial [Acinetobacter baumannii]|nr:hypothetical protein [Acinetobacter baumannii]
MTIAEPRPEVVDEPGVPPVPPRGWKPPRVPKAPRVPAPPRKPPRPPREFIPMTRGQAIARAVFATIGALLIAFVLNLTVFSHLQHLVSQEKLTADY